MIKQQLERKPGILSRAFNRAAQPNIVLYAQQFAGTTRGDLHGYQGLGRRLADILQGEYTELGPEQLAPYSPQNPSTVLQLQHYFNEHPVPDILLTREKGVLQLALGKRLRSVTLTISDINECLTFNYRVPGVYRELVPHHLTPAMLKAEGDTFRQHYAGQIEGELVGYVMMDPGARSLSHIAAYFASRARFHDKITFFICTSYRTPDNALPNFLRHLENYARDTGVADRIKVIAYDYNTAKKNGDFYNPYRGLLDAADHLVVGHESESVISEAVFAGKTVHMATHLYHGSELQRNGRIVSPKMGEPFVTKRHTPLNATDAVAQVIARKYKMKKLLCFG